MNYEVRHHWIQVCFNRIQAFYFIAMGSKGGGVEEQNVDTAETLNGNNGLDYDTTILKPVAKIVYKYTSLLTGTC